MIELYSVLRRVSKNHGTDISVSDGGASESQLLAEDSCYKTRGGVSVFSLLLLNAISP